MTLHKRDAIEGKAAIARREEKIINVQTEHPFRPSVRQFICPLSKLAFF